MQGPQSKGPGKGWHHAGLARGTAGWARPGRVLNVCPGSEGQEAMRREERGNEAPQPPKKPSAELQEAWELGCTFMASPTSPGTEVCTSGLSPVPENVVMAFLLGPKRGPTSHRHIPQRGLHPTPGDPRGRAPPLQAQTCFPGDTLEVPDAPTSGRRQTGLHCPVPCPQRPYLCSQAGHCPTVGL